MLRDIEIRNYCYGCFTAHVKPVFFLWWCALYFHFEFFDLIIRPAQKGAIYKLRNGGFVKRYVKILTHVFLWKYNAVKIALSLVMFNLFIVEKDNVRMALAVKSPEIACSLKEFYKLDIKCRRSCPLLIKKKLVLVLLDLHI